jgi:glycosyltransferase involved in cell wall biosynthesis
MNLLYCCINVPSEGSQTHIDGFIRAWKDLGHPLHVLSVAEQPYTGDKQSWSIWRRWRVRAAWYLDNVVYWFRILVRVLTKRPDVVLFRFDAMHRFAAAIIGMSPFVPVVLEVNAVRSIETSADRPRISDLLDRWSLKCARRLFVVSDRLKEHLVAFYGIQPSRIAVIENGVDPMQFSPDIDGGPVRANLDAADRFLIGFVGSFRPWHGIAGLIDLAERLSHTMTDVLFVLVGDGIDRAKYEHDVERRQLAEHVRFVGHVAHDGVPGYLAAMDVVIYPMPTASFAQGFYGSALKIFEYMAMGKVVITSPMGQMKELITDGASGYLVPAEELDKIVDCITRVRADAVLRDRIEKQARSTVLARYTWRENAIRVHKLCSDAMNVRA